MQPQARENVTKERTHSGGSEPSAQANECPPRPHDGTEWEAEAQQSCRQQTVKKTNQPEGWLLNSKTDKPPGRGVKKKGLT